MPWWIGDKYQPVRNIPDAAVGTAAYAGLRFTTEWAEKSNDCHRLQPAHLFVVNRVPGGVGSGSGSAPGSVSHRVASLVLTRSGLKPSDVGLSAVGSGTGAVMALRAG